jgi:hypothetical protein
VPARRRVNTLQYIIPKKAPLIKAFPDGYSQFANLENEAILRRNRRLYMRIFKQWGMQRTGTNFNKDFLERNCNCLVHTNVFGWKHGPRPDPAKWLKDSPESRWRKYGYSRKALEGHIPCLEDIVVIKNPWAWVDSFSRYKGISVRETAGRPLDMYIKAYRDWLKHGTLFVYEQALEDPEAALASLDIEAGEADMPEKRIWKGSKKKGVYYLGQKFDPSPYLDRAYLDKVPVRTIANKVCGFLEDLPIPDDIREKYYKM